MKFQVHQQNFFNECQLLLQLVIADAQTGNDMLENSEHTLWHSQSLGNRLSEHLGKNHESCQIVVEEAQEVPENIRKELKCYEILLTHASKVGPILKSHHRYQLI